MAAAAPAPKPPRAKIIRTAGLDGLELAAALKERRERENARRKAYRDDPANKPKIVKDHATYYQKQKAKVDAQAYRNKIERDRLAAEADPTFKVTRRSPKAAAKHGVLVEAAPTLVLPPEDVIAPPRDVRAIVPPPKATPSHPVDVAHPASYKIMIATIFNKAKPSKDDATPKAYTKNIARIFRELGVTVPADVLDVKPYLDRYEEILGFIPTMKQERGKRDMPYKTSSQMNYFAVLRWIASHFDDAQLKPSAVAAYKLAVPGHKPAVEAARTAAKASQTVDAFPHIIDAVLAKYGSTSAQYVYVLIHRDAPGRDNFGRLVVVDTLAAMRAVAKTFPVPMNYLITRYVDEDNETPHMVIHLNDYKTSDSRGTIIKPLRGDTARVVDLYRDAHPGEYLFMNGDHAWGKMSNFVGAMLKGAGLKEPGHNVGSINALRHSWASTYTDQLAPGAAAELMDHSAGIHDAVYIDKLRAIASEKVGSTDDVAPPTTTGRKKKAVVRDAADETASQGGGAPRERPSTSSRPSTSASHGPANKGRYAVAGDDDDDGEVEQFVFKSANPITPMAKQSAGDSVASAVSRAKEIVARAREKAKALSLAAKLQAAKDRVRESTAQKALAALNAVRKSNRARRPSARHG